MSVVLASAAVLATAKLVSHKVRVRKVSMAFIQIPLRSGSMFALSLQIVKNWPPTLRSGASDLVGPKIDLAEGMKHKCPHCHLQRDLNSETLTILRRGYYDRKSDGQKRSRFWCSRGGKYFSAATTSPLRDQKKRHLNLKIRKLLTGGMSQREIARVLKINRKTLVRKFRFASSTAYDELKASQLNYPLVVKVEFDDLETFEHTTSAQCLGRQFLSN